MNPRRLLILGAAAVVAIVVAVLLANRTMQTTRGENALLYPELKAQADSVEAIRIFKAGDERTIEIIRNGAEWTLTERYGHPIAAVKARNLVRALANAKVLEEKTSDPSKYAALSVEDVTDAEAKGVRIELQGLASPVNLIVGKDGPGGKSSYVRRVGEERSWLVSEQLSASPEPSDWLEKEIINVASDRVQSATITIGGQKPYTASKAARTDANFKVEPLPRGKELSSESAANSAANALMHLSLDDVMPKAEIASGKPSAQATYKTFDGLVVQLDGFEKDDKHYITLTTSYDADLAKQFETKPAEDEKTEETKSEAPAEATAPATNGAPNVADEAKKMAEKTAQWAYEIPSYKYDAIFRPLDELLKD